MSMTSVPRLWATMFTFSTAGQGGVGAKRPSSRVETTLRLKG